MKNLLLLISLMCFAIVLNAQIFFGPENNISKPSIANPETIDATDLDSDGDLDALVVSRGTQSIVWHENLNGNGDFGPPIFLAGDLNQPSNSIGVDIDGDGDMDVVVAGWGSNVLFWLENLDGMGNFSEIKMIDDYANGIWRVRNADVDNDGDQDLLSAEREGGKVIWYDNTDGKGTFSEAIIIFEGTDDSNLRDAFPADIDNDGDFDVVSADWFLKTLTWFENTDGLGTFSAPNLISDIVDDIDIVFCNDIDKDGFIDILARDRTEVFWLKNIDGGNNFSQPKNISQGETIIDYFPSDFDGDNDMDLLVVNTYYGNLGWFKNNGQGVFGPLQIIPNDIGGSDFIHAADIDGDGDQDYIGMSWAKSWVYWHENTDGNGDTQFPKYISKAEIAGPFDMVLSDMNGDNDKEILLASRYEHKLYYYERMSREGEYGTIKELPGFVFQPSSIFPADIDNDGEKDLISASFNNGELFWSKNNGNNQFGLPIKLGDMENSATDVFAADMDGDGDNDVLGTSLYRNELSLFENDGTGNFNNKHLISDQMGGAYDVIAVDLDGDNDKDIACASRHDDKISWFENMGNLNFGAENVIDGDMNGTRKVISGDMDGDGDEDIIASAWNKLNWYENLGARTDFSEAKQIMDENDYLRDINDIKVIDIDNDGDLDVFAVSEDNDNITWYTNENNGTSFVKQIDVVSGLNEPATIGFDDVDLDGRLDAIVSSFSDNKIGWYKNELYPVFLQQPADQTFCQSGNATYTISADKVDSYQWQISWPYSNWFEDLEENAQFTGTQTANLNIDFEDNNLDQARFKCIITYLGATFTSEPAFLNIDRLIEANAGSDVETCKPFYYLYANNPNHGTGQWSIVEGSAVFDDPGLNNATAQQIQHGTNVFQWTITNGTCISDDEVTIIKYDSITLSLPFESLEKNSGDQMVLNATTTGDVLTYQWYMGGDLLNDDGRITGSTTATLTIDNLTINDAGRYNCAVDGECNYIFSENMYLTVLTVGTEDLKIADVKVFPNPANSILNVQSDQLVQDYQLLNTSGIIIREEKVNKREFTVRLNTLAPGIYYLAVQLKDNRLLKRLIIE